MKALDAVAGSLLIVGLLAAFAWLPRLIHPRDERVGQDAPKITVPLIANAADLGASVSTADLKGRPVLLDFWATWCGPCQAEAPIVERVASRYKSRGLVVIGVNTSDPEGIMSAGPWAQAHRITYPIAFDEGPAAHAYEVDSLPTLVVISREGKITARRTGMTDGDEIERLVNSVL
jgi:thiol-disulfide isomerase/thioredoxin